MSRRIERPGIVPALGVTAGRVRGLELGLVDLSWGLYSASDFLSGSGLVTVEYDSWKTNAEETFDFDAGSPTESLILEEGTYLFFQSAVVHDGGGAAATDWANLGASHTGDSFGSLPLGIFTPVHGSPIVQQAPSGAGPAWYPHLIEMRVYNEDNILFPAISTVTVDLDFSPGDNIVTTLIVRISNPTPTT